MAYRLVRTLVYKRGVGIRETVWGVGVVCGVMGLCLWRYDHRGVWPRAVAGNSVPSAALGMRL